MSKRGVNKVILVGNVGKDPEIRYLPSGAAVANLTLATSESWKDKNTGQQQEQTEWHKCAAFGKLAEIIQQYVTKGSKLYIDGSLRTRSWEQDGVTRYQTEIIINDMQMLDSRNGGPAAAQQQSRPAQQQSSAPIQPTAPASHGIPASKTNAEIGEWDDFDDTSIPF